MMLTFKSLKDGQLFRIFAERKNGVFEMSKDHRVYRKIGNSHSEDITGKTIILALNDLVAPLHHTGPATTSIDMEISTNE